MNIGIDAHMLGQNETGNENYILELARAVTLLAPQINFYLLVENQGAVPEEIARRPNVRVIKLGTRSSVLRLLLEMPRLAAYHRFDLLHLTYNAPFICPCPLVVTVHDISFVNHPEWFSAKDRRLLSWMVPRSIRKAQKVLVDSAFTKNELLTSYGLNPAKIACIPLAVNPRFNISASNENLLNIRQKYKLPEEFILSLGNLQPRKNQLGLLKAFALALKTAKLNHKLVIVGQAHFQSELIYRAVAEYGLTDKVIFTGYVPDEELPLLYQAATLFVFPSLYEGFGIPVLEAMASGTPVIASRGSSLPEVVGKAARLVDPQDSEELVTAMVELATDAKLRACLQQRGYEQVQGFSWAETGRQTIQVYQETAKRSD